MLGIVTNNSNPVFTLNIPGRKGVIGMMACPGIRIESPRRGNVQKNLRRDLVACQEWGASGIVTFNQFEELEGLGVGDLGCLLYTSPSPRDGLLSRMPSSA